MEIRKFLIKAINKIKRGEHAEIHINNFNNINNVCTCIFPTRGQNQTIEKRT